MVEIKSVIDLDEIETDLHFLFKRSAPRRENYKFEKEITEITAHFMKKHVKINLLVICQNFWADAKFACLEQLPKEKSFHKKNDRSNNER